MQKKRRPFGRPYSRHKPKPLREANDVVENFAERSSLQPTRLGNKMQLQ